jgi:tetratricopeptide (TPR) repeat protein
VENGEDLKKLTRPPFPHPAVYYLVLLVSVFAGPFAGYAFAQEVSPEKARAASLAEEAKGSWERKDYPKALESFRSSLELDAKAQTFKDLGDLCAELDRHDEAIAAYRAAAAADPSLEPEMNLSIGEQFLWSDRPREAIPLLKAAVAGRPSLSEPKRRLALAYRWSDRLPEAELLYRSIVAADPSDVEAIKGLAETLVWLGRHREAAALFREVLGNNASDEEALIGLSRSLLFQDLPEEAAVFAERAQSLSPGNKDADEQAERVRERLERRLMPGLRFSTDSDDLSIYEITLSARARPRSGLEIEGEARERLFRQGSPGKDSNIDGLDSADGSGGSLSASYRKSADLALHAGIGYERYDAGGFHPWSGRLGITAFPGDTIRCALEWERSHFDTILSFQNRVTADTLSLSGAKHFLWKTEIALVASLIRHRNRNETGQERENRGERVALDLSYPLYGRGDDARVKGILRLEWRGFSKNLNVGVFNPERYTKEVAGLEWGLRFLPMWEFHGTLFGGAEQEKGHDGGLTYSADAALDRRIGRGLVSAGAFISDSIAKGQGEGFRRYGGLLIFRWPF